MALAPIRDLDSDELALLPASERERDFETAGRRRQFQSGRWLLRALLKARGDRVAASQDIRVGEHGKPYFEHGPAFSIAHAGDRVACCASDVGPVGIDLEFTDRRRNIKGIAKRFFSADEAERLATQPVEHFFMLWVLKESWVKARGLSIFGHLGEPGFFVEPPSIRVTGDSGDSNRHALFELDGAYLAVATGGDLPAKPAIRRWDIDSQCFVVDDSVRLVAQT